MYTIFFPHLTLIFTLIKNEVFNFCKLNRSEQVQFFVIQCNIYIHVAQTKGNLNSKFSTILTNSFPYTTVVHTSTTMHQSDADLIYKHCKNTQNYTASYQDKYDLVTNHIFFKVLFLTLVERRKELKGTNYLHLVPFR